MNEADRLRQHYQTLGQGSHPSPDLHPVSDYLNREGFNPVGFLLEQPLNFMPGSGEGWFQGNQPAWAVDGQDYYPSAAENWAEGGLLPRTEAVMQWLARGGDAATAAGLGTMLTGLGVKPGAVMVAGGQAAKGTGKLGANMARNFRARQKNRLNREQTVRASEDEVLQNAFTPEKLKRAEDAARAEYDEGQRIAAGENVDADIPVDDLPTSERGRVDPDYWRQEERKGRSQASLIRRLDDGEHLRSYPGDREGFIGAPRHIRDGADMETLRADVDGQIDEAIETVRIADPERLGTWYGRQKAAHDLIHEPHQLDRGLETHAAYSAGVSPQSELGFANKHWNNRNLVGDQDPQIAYRGAPARMLDRAVEYDEPALLAFKTGEYKTKSDPRVRQRGLYGVNDFRAAQTWRFEDPQGNPWTAGVTDTMHPFMDGENALATHRARERRAGGRANWQGEHMQELPWVLGKAQDQFSRGSRTESGRYFGEGTEGMRQAIRDANNTIMDYLPEGAGSMTYEQIPGEGTGHRADLLGTTLEQQRAYANEAPWTQGPQNNDSLYSAMNMRQLPTIPSTGFWTPTGGESTVNAMDIARPLLDFPTWGGPPTGATRPLPGMAWKGTMTGDINEHTRQAVTAAERLRAVIDGQIGFGGSIPNTRPAVPNRNAILIDTRRAGDPDDPFTGQQWTPEQARLLEDRLKRTGEQGGGIVPEGVIPPASGWSFRDEARVAPADSYGMSATNRGVQIFPFDAEGASTVSRRRVEDSLGSLLQVDEGPVLFPGARIESSRANTFYGPGIAEWGPDGLVPTEPGSGKATTGLLEEMAQAPDRAMQNLATDEGVRQSIRGKIRRDEGHPLTRDDLQRTRQFFAEADWGRAVQMIKKGAAPTAALAALGYSAVGMAAEDEQTVMEALMQDAEGGEGWGFDPVNNAPGRLRDGLYRIPPRGPAPEPARPGGPSLFDSMGPEGLPQDLPVWQRRQLM